MQKLEVEDKVRLRTDVIKTTTIENITTTICLLEGAKGYVILDLGNGTYSVDFDGNVINVPEKYLEYINDHCSKEEFDDVFKAAAEWIRGK